jgi:hypothetical protein
MATNLINDILIKDNLLYVDDTPYIILTNKKEEDKYFSNNANSQKYLIKYELPNNKYVKVDFKTKKHFIEVYNNCIINNVKGLYFHEIINNKNIKLFFDIDIKNTKANEKYFNMTDRQLCEEIINNVINANIKDYNKSYSSFLNGVIIGTNHRENKKSFRIIYPNLGFDNVKGLKNFILKVFENKYDFIDCAVYQSNNSCSCRLIYSLKVGETEGFKRITQLKNKNVLFDTSFLVNGGLETTFIIETDYELNENLDKNEFCDVSDNDELNNTKLLKNMLKLEDIRQLLNVKHKNIMNSYKLSQGNKFNQFILTNKGGAPCFIGNKDGKTHKKDNAVIYVNLTPSMRYVNLTCYGCKNDNVKYGKLINKKIINEDEYKSKSFYDNLNLTMDKYEVEDIEFIGYDKFYSNDKYLSLEELTPHLDKLLYLSIFCGGGKTYITCRILKYIIDVKKQLEHKNKNLYIVIVSPRRVLTSGIIEQQNNLLEEDGVLTALFQSYLNYSGTTIKEFTSNFRICSPESLDKLCGDLINNDNKQIYMVIEETPHTIRQFQGKTHKNALTKNIKCFEKLIKKSFGLCCLSATPDNISNKYLKKLVINKPVAFDFTQKTPVKNLIIYNDTPEDKKKGIISGRTLMINHLFNELKNRNYPIAFGWYEGTNATDKLKTSKLDKFINRIKSKFGNDLIITTIYGATDDKIKCDFGRNPIKFLEDEKTQLFIYTSTLNVGTDIQYKFKNNYLFINRMCCNHASDFIQMIWRTRICNNNHMIMSYFNAVSKTEIEKLTLDIKKFKNLTTKDEDIKLIKSGINYEELNNKLDNSEYGIIEVIEDMDKHSKKNYIIDLLTYCKHNRIIIQMFEEVDNNKIEDIYNLKEFKTVDKEYKELVELEHEQTINTLELLNVDDYNKLQDKMDKNNDDYISIKKYNIYKNGYVGALTVDLLKCYYDKNFMKNIKNIKLLLNFKHTIEFEEVKNDDIFSIIDKLMLNHTHYTLKIQSAMKKNYIANFKIKYNNTITNDALTVKKNLLKNISFKLNDIKNIIDSATDKTSLIKELTYNIEDDKFKCYVALWFIVSLDIPILQNRVYTRQEFETLTEKVDKFLKLEVVNNKKLLKVYLKYVDYTKASIKNLLKNTDSKAVVILIKSIVKIFGMTFKFKEDKNATKKHKYILDLKKKIRKNISIYKQNQKIPLINHEECNITNIDSELRQRIQDVETLILNPIK